MSMPEDRYFKQLSSQECLVEADRKTWSRVVNDLDKGECLKEVEEEIVWQPH